MYINQQHGDNPTLTYKIASSGVDPSVPDFQFPALLLGGTIAVGGGMVILRRRAVLA
jgi:hypothetical protein